MIWALCPATHKGAEFVPRPAVSPRPGQVDDAAAGSPEEASEQSAPFVAKQASSRPVRWAKASAAQLHPLVGSRSLWDASAVEGVQRREHFTCQECGATGVIPAQTGQQTVAGIPGTTVTCPRCNAVVRIGETVIEVQGTHADEVQSVATALAGQEAERRARQEELEAERRAAARKLAGPWSSGLFYLLAAVVLVGVVLAVAVLAAVWAVPLIIIGAIVLLSIVGALQLRQDDKLSEKGFLALMKLSLSQIKVLARVSPPRK